MSTFKVSIQSLTPDGEMGSVSVRVTANKNYTRMGKELPCHISIVLESLVVMLVCVFLARDDPRKPSRGADTKPKP